MDPITPPDLANAVTGFCTVLAGLVALLLTWAAGPQPRRWLAVYAGIFITGVPTVVYHGFMEPAGAGLADIGTNLLLGWLLTVAVLGDYYSARARLWLGGALGAANLAYIAWRLLNPSAVRDLYALLFGTFGGFKVGEVLLIVNAVLMVALTYARHGRIPPPARRLWYLTTGLFLVGLALASAGNQQVDGRIFSWHALWHVVGGFGFMALWAYNHVRFGGKSLRH